MKRMLLLLFLAMALVIGVVGCKEGTENLLTKSAISTAAYLLCKQEAGAIAPMTALCGVPSEDAGGAIAALYTEYEGRLADYPYAKMQVQILLDALAEEAGVDLLDPAVDLAAVDGERIKPFMDAVCAGVVAAQQETLLAGK